MLNFVTCSVEISMKKLPCYVQPIDVHEAYMMNGVWSGLCYQHLRPRSKQCTEAPIYANSHRNKLYMVDKIKHIFLVLVLSTQSVFKHYKSCCIQHICMHRLVWGSFARGTPGQLPVVPMHCGWLL